MLHMLVTLLVVRMWKNVLRDERKSSLGKLIFIQTRSAMDASV